MTASHAETILQSIGANVRRLRLERGWTQTELAEASELKERWVQTLETGTANPTIKVLVAVADALGVETADLLAPAKPEPRPAGNPRK